MSEDPNVAVTLKGVLTKGWITVMYIYPHQPSEQLLYKRWQQLKEDASEDPNVAITQRCVLIHMSYEYRWRLSAMGA